KPSPGFQIAPEALFQIRQKMLEMLRDRYNLRHGCKAPSREWLELVRPKPTYTLSLLHTELYVTRPGSAAGMDEDSGRHCRNTIYNVYTLRWTSIFYFTVSGSFGVRKR